MKCPEYNKANLKVRRENRRYAESGLPNIVLVDVQVRHCPSCGAELVSLPRLSELHRAIALALISKPARLTSSEIKFLRKSLGWSGAEFARNLHVDPATVSRWESPRAAQTMSASNELLLRLAVAHSNQMADYEVDKLAEVAVEAASPLKITIRQKKTGWKTQEAA